MLQLQMLCKTQTLLTLAENNWEIAAVDAPVVNAMLNVDTNLVGLAQ